MLPIRGLEKNALQALHALQKVAKVAKTLAAQGFCFQSGVTTFVTTVTSFFLIMKKCYAQ